MASEVFSRWGVPVVLLTILWAGIARGNADSWVVGIPVVLLALAFLLMSRFLHPASRKVSDREPIPSLIFITPDKQKGP